MNKWLNRKPKVYDFSEDEIDTEPESEDDGKYWNLGQIWSIIPCFLILIVLLGPFYSMFGQRRPKCSLCNWWRQP